MTTKILTQSTLILQPRLIDNASAAGVNASHIRRAIPRFAPVIDLPASEYHETPRRRGIDLLPIISVIILIFAAVGFGVTYAVDRAGKALESLINGVSGIIRRYRYVVPRLLFAPITPFVFVA